ARRAVAALGVEVSLDDVLVRHPQPELLSRLAEALEAVGGGVRVERARDGRDPSMPQLVQVLDGGRGAGAVVGRDETATGTSEVGVDRDARHAGRDQLPHLRILAVESHYDHAADAVVLCPPRVRMSAAKAVPG